MTLRDRQTEIQKIVECTFGPQKINKTYSLELCCKPNLISEKQGGSAP